MEIIPSVFKLRANAPKGRKAISYQLAFKVRLKKVMRMTLNLLAPCICMVQLADAQNYEPATSTPGTPGDAWYKRMTPALNNTLRAITHGNGLWVAVGDGGALLRSADGKTWTEAVHGGGDNMKAVAWTGSRYVAVGRVGSCYVSSDGIQWRRVSTSAVYDLNAITWTGSNLVAAGSSGAVVISSDGLTWAPATTKPPLTFTSYCIASSGARLVSGGNGIYYSDDGGLNWTAASSPPTSTLKGVAWNGTNWCAAGDKGGTWWATSPNADAWIETQIATGEAPQALIVDNDQALIATKHTTSGYAGEILYSGDAGANWMGMAQPFVWHPLAMAMNAGKWLAVGTKGMTATSADAVNWETRFISGLGSWRNTLGTADISAASRNLPASAQLLSCLMKDHFPTLVAGGSSSIHSRVAWNGSIFAAVGDQSVFLSTDGIEWTDNTPDIFQFLPEGICWTGSHWVIIATFGKVFTSSDALNWTQSSIPMTYPEGAISVGSRVVAIGRSGQLASTSDGTNWSFVDLGIRDMNDIAWHDGRYVAVGDYGFAVTSTDGVNWTEIPSATTTNLSVVKWHNGRFIAIGSFGGKPVLTTTDGSGWKMTQSEIGFSPTEAISLDGTLMAINTEDQRWASTRDGLSWTISSLAILPTYSTGAWNGRYFCVTSTGGRYFLSTDGAQWEEQGTRPSIGKTIPYGNGFISTSARGIKRSTDSFNWESVYEPADTAPYLYGLASSGSAWVAIGDSGSIIHSSDGSTWAPVASGTAWPLRDAIWAGDRFVVSGYGGGVLTSTDGITWQAEATGRSGLIQSLAWTGSTLYALDSERYLLSTSDFESWNVLDLGSATRVYSLIWTGERLAAMSVISSEANLMESTDGTTWTYKPAGFYGVFSTLIWDSSQYIAIGSQGVMTSGHSSGGFDKWASNRELPGLSFEEVDAGTGYPVGLIYAFDFDQPPAALMTLENGSSANQAFLHFSVPKLSSGDITYHLETSSTMEAASWSTIGSKLPHKAWSFGSQSYEVSATLHTESFKVDVDKSANSRAFYRLRVIQN